MTTRGPSIQWQTEDQVKAAQSHDWATICAGCGECCGAYPLPVELFERFSDRVQVPLGFMATDDEYTMPLTVDGLCPFLSRHDRICTIYAARPPVCWWYGEIPELPCGKLEPQAARLSFDQIVERIGKRLRMADERRRYQTTS